MTTSPSISNSGGSHHDGLCGPRKHFPTNRLDLLELLHPTAAASNSNILWTIVKQTNDFICIVKVLEAEAKFFLQLFSSLASMKS